MKKHLILFLTMIFMAALASASSAGDTDEMKMEKGMMAEGITDEMANGMKEEMGDHMAESINDQMGDGMAKDMKRDMAGEMADDMTEAATEKKMDGSMKQSDSSAWGVAYSAKAMISGTDPDSAIKGRIDFVQTGDGVQVVATLANVGTAGKHGLHVHENGSCEDMGKAAGGHFNPMNTKHGLLPRDGKDMAHGGDMGNIEIDDQGKGSLVIFLPGLSLTEGENNITGKAVILHEKEDDFGQPTGNAGGRIACGLIEANK